MQIPQRLTNKDKVLASLQQCTVECLVSSEIHIYLNIFINQRTVFSVKVRHPSEVPLLQSAGNNVIRWCCKTVQDDNDDDDDENNLGVV